MCACDSDSDSVWGLEGVWRVRIVFLIRLRGER